MGTRNRQIVTHCESTTGSGSDERDWEVLPMIVSERRKEEAKERRERYLYESGDKGKITSDPLRESSLSRILGYVEEVRSFVPILQLELVYQAISGGREATSKRPADYCKSLSTGEHQRSRRVWDILSLSSPTKRDATRHDLQGQNRKPATPGFEHDLRRSWRLNVNVSYVLAYHA